MNTEALVNNWALIAAAIPALLVAILIGRYLIERTAGGQLTNVLKDHQEARNTLAKLTKASARATSRAEKLNSRSGSVPPQKSILPEVSSKR